MTDSPASAPALLRRLPLTGLYPAGYRAAHGEEITAVFAEALQRADPRTALREWAALAAHAVRLRTRLSSSDPAGRILAGAAPFLLAGAAALGAVQLLIGLLLGGSATDTDWAVGTAQTAPWVLALVCAALGRWAPARALVLAAVATGTAVAVAALFHPTAAFTQYSELLGLWAVTGVLVLIAPPDAVDLSRRGRSWAVGSAVAIALPMSGIALFWIGTWPEEYPNVLFPPSTQALLDASTAWPVLVLSLVYLVRLGRPNTDPLQAGGVALAVLPWTLMVAPPLYRSTPVDAPDLLRNAGVVLALLATATAAGILRRTSRRARLTGPVGPVGPRASDPAA
ncbi:hypothetical protein ACFVVX_15980 [Kitasatospora sp. NPDC058170]|uniref:hypothetical protein n=1 Tax=Kitasatospora sp. NPDC058170 TaxID=3346364 RepID=UPI0036DA909A